MPSLLPLCHSDPRRPASSTGESRPPARSRAALGAPPAQLGRRKLGEQRAGEVPSGRSSRAPTQG